MTCFKTTFSLRRKKILNTMKLFLLCLLYGVVRISKCAFITRPLLFLSAEANVYTEMVMHPTSTKSRVQIENEAFNKLMYGDDIPKRPVGYGFGVNQSDVFGVRSILRKEKFHNAENDRLKLQDMEKKVANLTEINEGLIKQNQDIMKTNNTNQELLKKVLDVLSTGTTSTEVVNLAKNILHATTTQEPTS